MTQIADFVIYEDTRKPDVTTTLTQNGAAADLSGANVKWRMRSVVPGSPLKVDTDAIVVSPTDGTVRYEWASQDLDTHGVYRGWWWVTFSDGKTAQFPSRKTYVIDVREAA